jgi:hypothetical protein
MNRQHLPSRRTHEVREIQWAGLRWTIGVGRDRIGRIVEVFASDLNKSAPAFEAVVRDGAIILSLLLQNGGDLSHIGRAITLDKRGGEPASALGAIVKALEEMR